MGKKKACMQRRRSKKVHPSENWVWVPKIPLWEKEFCKKIGRFEWKEFLEAKKMISLAPKILEWDDSAGEEAFHRSKKRFYAMKNGLHINLDELDIPNPDSYIDEIDWDNDDDKENVELLEGLVSAADERGEDDENNIQDNIPDYYHIRIEDIKPTGWDVDFEELSKDNILTGLIVGC